MVADVYIVVQASSLCTCLGYRRGVVTLGSQRGFDSAEWDLYSFTAALEILDDSLGCSVPWAALLAPARHPAGSAARACRGRSTALSSSHDSHSPLVDLSCPTSRSASGPGRSAPRRPPPGSRPRSGRAGGRRASPHGTSALSPLQKQKPLP